MDIKPEKLRLLNVAESVENGEKVGPLVSSLNLIMHGNIEKSLLTLKSLL